MSRADRRRWDERWKGMSAKAFDVHPLLISHRHLLDGGLALDLACGRGQNALWLAAAGHRVIAVDVSRVALEAGLLEAGRLGVDRRILFVQADLDRWRPPPDTFHLICVFRFLERRLFPDLEAALRPGGLLLYSTRHAGIRRRLTDANPAYLLARGELATAFPGLETLHYGEDEEEAALVARREKR